MSAYLNDPGWWARLRRQIAGLTRAPHDAGDLLNAAYIKLKESDGAPVENAEAYLVRTAVNLARDEHRRRLRQPAGERDPLSLAAIADAAPLPDEVLHARQRLNAVRTMLDRLNPRTRQILLMHRLDGLRYREIAERLGISESAVEKHVAKGALQLYRYGRSLHRDGSSPQ